ncbi:hypothetical protein [Ramlibacter sp.]|uniref:hypothetical protein n=1 Tax=Ramlibacter sp. TaxID=1917967 RepID=UPI003D146D33
MKVEDLHKLLADVPDDAEINFADGNFGGRGDDLNAGDITISPDRREVLIRPPYWTAVD